MAQKVTVNVTDDLTGEVIEPGQGGTVTFGLDGSNYEIDLSNESADRFREQFADYIAAARKAPTRAGGRSGNSRPGRSNSEELQKIREWAQQNGHEVSSRGRIATSVREAYDAAH